MSTKAQEQTIINNLNTIADVQDVYFHKGVLYVVNSYDIPAVTEYMDSVFDLAVTVRSIEEEPSHYE